MDPVSHGLLGAAAACLPARREELRLAALAGLAGAMIPDTDVLFLSSAADPLREVEFHRHFTHALAFVPVGGLVAATVLWLLLRRRVPFLRLWLFAALGTLTAGLLDTCTSFGTHLFWPFDARRTSWSLIAIVDPVFTLALATGVVVALRRRSRTAVAATLGFVLAYLSAGAWQKERATEAVRQLAAARGDRIERIEVHPTIGNLLLWRGVYESGGRYRADAIRAGLGAPRVYPGGSIAKVLPAAMSAGALAGSVLAGDVERFDRFTDGWLVLHPERPTVVGDIRFSMLPNGTRPLWGIEVDPARRDRHAPFLNFRDADKAVRGAFLAMLAGTDPP